MWSLKEKLFKRACELGIELSEKELKAVLHDIERWLKVHTEGEGRILTADGSYTLISREYGEPFHSVSAGAVSECLRKFLEPSMLREKARVKGKVAILDVGFGLGYNTAIAVYEIKKTNPSAFIEVIAFEKEVPEIILYLPPPYRDTHRFLLNLLPEGEREGISVRLILGDMRSKAKGITFQGDTIFYDPFSPYKNAEAWSLELLSVFKGMIKEDGIWVSYTSSLPVRKSLSLLGFKVWSTAQVGRKRGGTAASVKAVYGCLEVQEVDKLRNSPYSLPFRDPELNREPIDILVDYRLRVLERERRPSEEGKTTPQRLPS